MTTPQQFRRRRFQLMRRSQRRAIGGGTLAPITLAGGAVVQPGKLRMKRYGCERCGDPTPVTRVRARFCSDRCRAGYPKEKGLH